MMKKIAILGANHSICPLIIKAKEMGYITYVFSQNSEEPGAKIADHFYEISIANKNQILEKCRIIKPDGIVSITSDYAVGSVNYVARNLGLQGNSEKTDDLARDKYHMRMAFKNAGLYVPSQIYEVKDPNSIECINLDYPLIVKPADRWNSAGVTRVDS